MQMAVMSVLALSIPLNWTTHLVASAVLGVLSVVVLVKGTGPDSPGASWADGLRWLVWPLFLVCVIAIFARGIFA